MAEGDTSAQHPSLFIFKEDNPIRRKAKALAEWLPFEYFVLLVIIANCIIIGLGFYLPAGDPTAEKLEATELYFLIIFIFEMIVKVIAYGFCMHPGSYIRDPWNILDFFIIIVGIISLFPLGVNLNVLRFLRAFRLLRLLRFIKYFRRMCNKE